MQLHTRVHMDMRVCIDTHENTLNNTIILFETVGHQFSMNKVSVKIGLHGHYITVVRDTICFPEIHLNNTLPPLFGLPMGFLSAKFVLSRVY